MSCATETLIQEFVMSSEELRPPERGDLCHSVQECAWHATMLCTPKDSAIFNRGFLGVGAKRACLWLGPGIPQGIPQGIHDYLRLMVCS